jgi:hypothetical protein
MSATKLPALHQRPISLPTIGGLQPSGLCFRACGGGPAGIRLVLIVAPWRPWLPRLVVNAYRRRYYGGLLVAPAIAVLFVMNIFPPLCRSGIFCLPVEPAVHPSLA